MDINHLRYVVALSETKNFSKAAELLFISQPALSQYISRLEKNINVKLFNRNKSDVSITEAGKIYVEDAKIIIELNNKLMNKMKDFSSETKNILTVGVSQFYGKYFIPRIIPKFREISPSLSIKIYEAESKILEQNLLDDKIDIAIIPLPISSKDIKYEVLYDEKILFAVNSTNKKLNELKDVTNLSIFKDEPFILLKKGFKLRTLTEDICNEYGFTPKVAFEAENLDTLNSLVSNNLGMSFLPDIINRFDNIKYMNIDNNKSLRNIVIAYKHSIRKHNNIEFISSKLKNSFQNTI